MMAAPSHDARILGTRVDATDYAEAAARVTEWVRRGESRVICAANVHMVMEAHDSEDFQKRINAADMVTPDGMPLVWALRLLGHKGQPRVYGPTLMLHVCRAAEASGVPVGFFGGRAEVIQTMQARLGAEFPGLRMVYAYAPPFRPLTDEEDAETSAEIAASGARVLFVGLGCPRQERWAMAHRGRISAVMLAVGAAFDFHAGRVRQAPPLLQKVGMEWAFRLMMEPRRLWRRYAYHNPRFVALLLWQFIRRALGGGME